jgi:hypothetical protein
MTIDTLDVVVNGERWVCMRPLDPEPEPEPEPEPLPVRVVAYSQRDPRWANVRLGASAYTMGGAGCAVTSVAMLASAVNKDFTPLDMVTWLNANGGFTSGGLLYWSKAAQAATGLTYVNYHIWRSVAADLPILRGALDKGPQVIQVDFKPATTVLDSHFVVALSLTQDGQDINIIDPWTGGRGTLLGLYANENWTLARAVYALAEYRIG